MMSAILAAMPVPDLESNDMNRERVPRLDGCVAFGDANESEERVLGNVVGVARTMSSAPSGFLRHAHQDSLPIRISASHSVGNLPTMSPPCQGPAGQPRPVRGLVLVCGTLQDGSAVGLIGSATEA